MTVTVNLWDRVLPERDRMTGPMVEVRDLVVQFGGVRAIDSLSYAIADREFVAVIGQNGAGKTTLLNVLSRLVIPSGGTVALGGQVVNAVSALEIARRGVGRSFQDPKLLDTTVVENLLVGAHLQLPYGLPSQFFRRRRVGRIEQELRSTALDILETAGLLNLAHEKASELPYGLRKLVDLLRALIGQPALLLLDEPSSGLDTSEQAIVRGLLQTLRDTRRTTAVVVEHHFDVVRSTTDRVLALESGHLFLSGTPAEVLDSPEFREAIVGRRGESMTTAEQGVSWTRS